MIGKFNEWIEENPERASEVVILSWNPAYLNYYLPNSKHLKDVNRVHFPLQNWRQGVSDLSFLDNRPGGVAILTLHLESQLRNPFYEALERRGLKVMPIAEAPRALALFIHP